MEVREGYNVVGESSIRCGRVGCIRKYTSDSYCQGVLVCSHAFTKQGNAICVRQIGVSLRRRSFWSEMASLQCVDGIPMIA